MGGGRVCCPSPAIARQSRTSMLTVKDEFEKIGKNSAAATGALVIGVRRATPTSPKRKDVNMLQRMQTKVAEEGEKEEKPYGKFICYCKNNAGDLEGSIAGLEEETEALEAGVKALEKAVPENVTKVAREAKMPEVQDAKKEIEDCNTKKEL